VIKERIENRKRNNTFNKERQDRFIKATKRQNRETDRKIKKQ
jgi:hypothetical protein